MIRSHSGTFLCQRTKAKAINFSLHLESICEPNYFWCLASADIVISLHALASFDATFQKLNVGLSEWLALEDFRFSVGVIRVLCHWFFADVMVVPCGAKHTCTGKCFHRSVSLYWLVLILFEIRFCYCEIGSDRRRSSLVLNFERR